MLNNTTILNFLPSPPSIIICLCRPFFTAFWFSFIFCFNVFGTCRHFSFWFAAHELILTSVFPHYLPGGVMFHIFWHLPLQRSYYMPCLSIASFCISIVLLSVIHLALASYCSWHLNVWCTMPPNVIHSLCNYCAYIGWILWIQLFCHVSFFYILANILLSCFLRPVL